MTGLPLVRRMLALCNLTDASSFDLTIAIDTPLGWPEAMLRLVCGGEPTSLYPTTTGFNPYTRRETEIELVKRGYQPLSAVRDMLGSQSTKGILPRATIGSEVARIGWAIASAPQNLDLGAGGLEWRLEGK